MVPFAGFWMPVSYQSIRDEHMAVRERVGIFDVSHMGELEITGQNVKGSVNEIITNDCSKLPPGGVQYTVMCRKNGTTVDDLLVYVLGDERVLLVVNAVNADKDFQHICASQNEDIRVEDVSDYYTLLAVQGPLSREVLKACPLFAPAPDALDEVAYYRHFSFLHEGMEIVVSRTGYTGELGFEIFVPRHLSTVFWRGILEAGKPFGIMPIGLAARDTLRFEASFCLYGHELDDETTPLQAGLGWVVKLGKSRFIGKEALVEEKRRGVERTLIGLELKGKAIARQGFLVRRGERAVGNVTSGNFSPALKKSLCLAYVQSGEAGREGGYSVDVRGKRIEACRTPLPFYKSRAR